MAAPPKVAAHIFIPSGLRQRRRAKSIIGGRRVPPSAYFTILRAFLAISTHSAAWTMMHPVWRIGQVATYWVIGGYRGLLTNLDIEAQRAAMWIVTGLNERR